MAMIQLRCRGWDAAERAARPIFRYSDHVYEVGHPMKVAWYFKALLDFDVIMAKPPCGKDFHHARPQSLVLRSLVDL